MRYTRQADGTIKPEFGSPLELHFVDHNGRKVESGSRLLRTIFKLQKLGSDYYGLFYHWGDGFGVYKSSTQEYRNKTKTQYQKDLAEEDRLRDHLKKLREHPEKFRHYWDAGARPWAPEEIEAEITRCECRLSTVASYQEITEITHEHDFDCAYPTYGLARDCIEELRAEFAKLPPGFVLTRRPGRYCADATLYDNPVEALLQAPTGKSYNEFWDLVNDCMVDIFEPTYWEELKKRMQPEQQPQADTADSAQVYFDTDSPDPDFAELLKLIDMTDYKHARQLIHERLNPASRNLRLLDSHLRGGAHPGQVRLVRSEGRPVYVAGRTRALAVNVEWFCEHILTPLCPDQPPAASN